MGHSKIKTRESEMVPKSVHDIRNVALFGQAGCGKTELLEALLSAAGAIGTAGRAASARPRKSGVPGVSRRLTQCSSDSR